MPGTGPYFASASPPEAPRFVSCFQQSILIATTDILLSRAVYNGFKSKLLFGLRGSPSSSCSSVFEPATSKQAAARISMQPKFKLLFGLRTSHFKQAALRSSRQPKFKLLFGLRTSHFKASCSSYFDAAQVQAALRSSNQPLQASCSSVFEAAQIQAALRSSNQPLQASCSSVFEAAQDKASRVVFQAAPDKASCSGSSPR